MNQKSEKAVDDAIQSIAYKIYYLKTNELETFEVLSKTIATLEMALASSADTK